MDAWCGVENNFVWLFSEKRWLATCYCCTAPWSLPPNISCRLGSKSEKKTTNKLNTDIKTNPSTAMPLSLLSFCYIVQPFSTVLLESQIGGPSISHRLGRHTSQKKVNSKNTQRVRLLSIHSLHAHFSVPSSTTSDTCAFVPNRHISFWTESDHPLPDLTDKPKNTWPLHTLLLAYLAPCINIRSSSASLFAIFFLIIWEGRPIWLARIP